MSVRAKNLTFGFDDFRLCIEEIEFASRTVSCVVGSNGAGKSTLLKCLGGILPLPAETVFCEGKDLTRMRSAEKSRLVCYVAQEQILSLNYSVLDIVLMGRASFISAFSVPSREDRIKARESLGYVGMSGFENRLFAELSSGERRLVLIARTLALEPKILLLDEPTTFLDPKHEIEVMELCRRLAGERGTTIVATMHNLDMAVKYAEFLVFMKNGRIVASGNPNAVLKEDLLMDVYDIRMKIINYEGRNIVLR